MNSSASHNLTNSKMPYIDQRTAGYNERFTFTGKEKDSLRLNLQSGELCRARLTSPPDLLTSFYYFGARYYDPTLSGLFISVDPMADKYPTLSPYAYCAWNPVKLVDPDGQWIWNSAGDLVAQKGDDINTMSSFLGTSLENCYTMLNRCGLITATDIDIKAGCVLPQTNLWVETRIKPDYAIIDNSTSAVLHYYKGKGAPVNIGEATTSLLFNSVDFMKKHKEIITSSQDNNDVFTVNMTKDVFHIGRTNVKYTKNKGSYTSTITYSAFSDDGFWDPAFWSERTLGKWGIGGNLYKPDGKGGHLELGGVPYDYIPRERTYFYKPEE